MQDFAIGGNWMKTICDLFASFPTVSYESIIISKLKKRTNTEAE